MGKPRRLLADGAIEQNLLRGVRQVIVSAPKDKHELIAQVINDLEKKCRRNSPEFRIATPYYKPGNNKTQRTPDYFLHETDAWLVFPHELSGLAAEEILAQKPGIEAIRHKLLQLQESR